MKTLKIKTATTESTIYCGKGAFESVASSIGSEQIFIVTDSNVSAIYGELIEKTFPTAIGKYVLPAGETSKNYTELFKILNAMAESGLTRKGFVVAMGGGVVGDIGGLAASLYMRGVRLVQIATTLLSQVDSSVGGKTAVDLGKIKNAVGTFYQAETVIVDPMFLETLPYRELRCGMGEIVKYAAIDKCVCDKVSSADDVYDLQFLEDITYDCVACKASVVERDEKDTSGLRAMLNAGHTVGHSLELCYGLRSHGEYVAIGLYYEMYMALKAGKCTREFFDSFEKLIRKVVIRMPRFAGIKNVAEISRHDKKNEKSSEIVIVAPVRRGESEKIKLPYDEYVKRLVEVGSLAKKEKPLRLGLIGKDVSKSTSDVIHPFICEKLGYDVVFEKISFPECEFDKRIAETIGRLDGFNVTIPYKLSVIPYVGKLMGDASVFGSVNTVCVSASEGYNTDGEGFVLMLKNAGIDVSGKRVLLVGAGGAGRAVAKKLKDLGAEVWIYSIPREGAFEVAEQFGLHCLEKIERGYDVIINATGVGMHESVGVSPVEEDVIASCAVAIDLIYEPEKSEFLRLAEKNGLKILNGRAMLFYQAYYADCKYLGLDADAATAKKLYKAYISRFGVK